MCFKNEEMYDDPTREQKSGRTDSLHFAFQHHDVQLHIKAQRIAHNYIFLYVYMFAEALGSVVYTQKRRCTNPAGKTLLPQNLRGFRAICAFTSSCLCFISFKNLPNAALQ